MPRDFKKASLLGVRPRNLVRWSVMEWVPPGARTNFRYSMPTFEFMIPSFSNLVANMSAERTSAHCKTNNSDASYHQGNDQVVTRL
jgi:hypothetical protein